MLLRAAQPLAASRWQATDSFSVLRGGFLGHPQFLGGQHGRDGVIRFCANPVAPTFSKYRRATHLASARVVKKVSRRDFPAFYAVEFDRAWGEVSQAGTLKIWRNRYNRS